MEIQIHTLQGTAKVQVLADSSVGDLKRRLHEEYRASLNVPEPDRQRLVFKDTLLSDADSLQQQGLAAGDAMVMLPMPLLPSPAPDNTPVPTSSIIRDAIYEEARARGIEHTLKEEAPRRGQLAGDDINRRIMELLEQALGGLQLPGVDAAAAAAGGGANPLAEAAAALAQASLQLAPHLAPPAVVVQGGGAPQPQQQQPQQQPPAVPEPPVQIPEPRPDQITSLTDMGFSEPLARKALLLTRCNVELALEWVLQHMDDPDAETPPTQEQLQQVYAPRRSAAPTPQLLTQTLVDMGFNQAAASNALRRYGNMEAALAFLLTGAGGPAAVAAQPAVAAAAAAESAGDQPQATAATSSSRASSEAAGTQGASSSAQARGNPAAEPASTVAGAAGAAAGQAGSSSAGSQQVAAGPSSHAVEQSDEDGASEAGDEEFDDAEYGEEEEEEEEEDDNEDEDDEADETYEEDDDEFEELDDELARHMSLHFEGALNIMRSVELAALGSADMEQLLQGASIEELYGHQLLMAPDAVDMGAQQEALQRVADIANLLQQALGGGVAGAEGQGGGEGGGNANGANAARGSNRGGSGGVGGAGGAAAEQQQ